MKKSLVISSAVVALAGSMSAQTFIAGWGFEVFDGAGSPTTIDFSTVSSQDSFYSSFDPNGVGSEASAYGTASWAGATEVFSGNLALNTSTGSATIGSTASKGIIDFENPTSSFTAAGNFAMGFTASGATMSFAVDALTFGSFEDWTISFAGQGGTGSVLVEFDAGSGFETVGNAVFGTSEQLFSYDSTAYTGSDISQDVVFRLTSTVTSGNLIFDNVQVGGTAVPEPSAFAAIAGALALAFVGNRRRRA